MDCRAICLVLMKDESFHVLCKRAVVLSANAMNAFILNSHSLFYFSRRIINDFTTKDNQLPGGLHSAKIVPQLPWI